jgi:hypothetical protein
MIRHSDSLILVWKIAELEARNLGAREIEPTHFFLGLLKVVDLSVGFVAQYFQKGRQDSMDQLSKDVLDLRSVFIEGGVESTPTRRRLRAHLHKGLKETEGRLRRRADSRTLFLKAETEAHEVVKPVHLLSAIFGAEIPVLESFLVEGGADYHGLAAAAGKLASVVNSNSIRPKDMLRRTGDVAGLDTELRRMRNGHKH